LYRFLADHEEISAAQGHHPVRPTPDSLIIRLRRGGADIAAFGRELQPMAGDQLVGLQAAEFFDGNPRRSMHVEAQALWLFSALLVLSALLVFGQTLSRFIAVESGEATDLRALGMTVWQVWAVAMVRMAAFAVVAAAVAGIAAAAASPLTPLGLARNIEPTPGISFDWSALALGLAGVLLFVLLLSIYPAWRAARTTAAEPAAERTSSVAGRFARAGLPPSVVAGTRMALESGRGRTSVPVRSTILGAIVGVAALAAALTFGTSLARLLQTPRLYGVVWDTRLTNYGGSDDGQDADLSRQLDVVGRQHGVAAVAAAVVGQTELAGRTTGLMAVYGGLRLPTLEGRYPTGPDDIALGARTMRRLRAHVGSTIDVAGPSGRPFRFRVVGKTVLPADADSRLGEGVLLSRAAVQRAVEGSGVPGGADSLLIRFKPGADQDAVVDRVQRAIDPRSAPGAALDVLPPQKPTDLVSFGGVEALPFVLAGILAVVAVATLAHLLVSAVRRRRRDLAILKTLGFVRRQVTAAVAWQATTLATIALIVGLPVGVAIGRALWAWFASQQGVVAEVRIPVIAVVLIIPAAIVVANVVAAVPARVASLTKPALVLRTE
jgi:ABC-type lipoprotein release transport system permease subunit